MLRLQAEGKIEEFSRQDVQDAIEVISDLKAKGNADWNVARILARDYNYTILQAKMLLLEWQRRRPKLA